MSDMESLNCAEYSYEKKIEGRLAAIRLGLIIGYAAFVTLFFAFCFTTRIIPLFAVCPILLWILVFFTWPLVKFDIRYTFQHGELTFYKEYSGLKGRTRKLLLNIMVQSASHVAPYTGERLEGRIYDFSSSTSASSLVFLEGRDGDGEVFTVVFDSIERVNKLLCAFAKDASGELRSYVYTEKNFVE